MEISLFLDLVTAVAVILGIIFGLLQLRHFHLSRSREADLLLLNTFHTGELLKAIGMLQELPNGQTKNEIEKKFGTEIGLVYGLLSTWERLGILVFNHDISVELVEDAFSEQIIISWQRLEKFVTDDRETLRQDRSFEWFQWLAERINGRRKSSSRRPAYIAHRNWK